MCVVYLGAWVWNIQGENQKSSKIGNPKFGIGKKYSSIPRHTTNFVKLEKTNKEEMEEMQNNKIKNFNTANFISENELGSSWLR